MAQIVFVHGVNTRRKDGDSTYDDDVKNRDRRFKELAFKGATAAIENPYWGEFGADPQWELACIPDVGAKFVDLALGDTGPDDALARAALADFEAVVASLSVADIEEATGSGDAKLIEEREKFWAAAASYVIALKGNKPPWLKPGLNDDDFLAELEVQVGSSIGVKSLSIGSALRNARDKLAGGFSNLVNGPIAKVGRDKLTPAVAIFIGDVFRYLKEGSARDNIRKRVVESIQLAATKAKNGNEPLVVFGHSMGGVILYDLLSDPTVIRTTDAALGFQLKVDLYVTVGSQVGLFEELKTFVSSDERIPRSGQKQVVRPPRVDRWWNAFDKMDVLSFLTEPVFAGAEDFAVDTIAGVKDAHSAYFTSAMFYQRLNVRLKQANLLR
jgi:hypothetical protein